MDFCCMLPCIVQAGGVKAQFAAHMHAKGVVDRLQCTTCGLPAILKDMWSHLRLLSSICRRLLPLHLLQGQRWVRERRVDDEGIATVSESYEGSSMFSSLHADSEC